jgi:hypothetical protein
VLKQHGPFSISSNKRTKTNHMNWINIDEKKPNLYDVVVLAVNNKKTKRLRFWKKKIIVFGWLDQVMDTQEGFECRFYDSTNNRHWKDSVTHWMSLPKPPEEIGK